MIENRPVPGDIDPKRAEASCRNGVLTVTVPKKAGPRAAAKRTPIEAR